MPSLEILLRDVAKKFPEIRPDSIGIQYEDLKEKSVYAFKEAPLEGVLLDKKGVRRDYLIGIGKHMRHAENLVKVGAIAHGVSSIYHHRKETVGVGVGREVLQVILGYNRLTYKDHGWEDTSTDSRQRGFGRSIDALDKYLESKQLII